MLTRASLLLALALVPSLPAQVSPAPAAAPAVAQAAGAPGRLLFQTDHSWSPRTNINADTVMVYGLDDTTAARIQSWRAHGYHVTVMTGVAWGRYGSYLRGDFDGHEHWDETQQEKSGKLILHGGRDVPYVSPSIAYGRFLAKGAEAAIDAGAEAIYLEEPEFWARAGWSPAFQREWQLFYHQPWQAPDSSPDAQYRASKLKYFLYRRALAQVFDAVKAYGVQHGRAIPCYVATHSLINYAQWSIVSPESSLLEVGADGYIAQVWTGTAREPNMYEGRREQRTFATAFLEYGALQNIARSSRKPIWFLNDPIEDNPRHSWTDYRVNWESTLVASLLQPSVARYEVLPWPDRIFGLDADATRPSAEPTDAEPNPPKTAIPRPYESELQAVFHALAEMDQPPSATRWESAGTAGMGVLVSDTLMFQRASPQPSDPNLSNFYGLALPLLLHGIPVEPVQIESTYSKAAPADFLRPYKVLLLTYEGQKPPSPEFHAALAAWVRQGGALVVADDDKDPYNQVSDWWNSGGEHFATPRDQLFQLLGLSPQATGLRRVGQGCVVYQPQSPSSFAGSPSGASQVLQLVQTAADAVHLPVKQASSFVLRRGPYVIAAGLDASGLPAPASLKGDFIDLFDPDLGESDHLEIKPGTRAFTLDLDAVHASAPRVLAASAKISREAAAPGSLFFEFEGIDQTQAAVRILTLKPVRAVLLNGQAVDPRRYQVSGRTLLLHLGNTAAAQSVKILFVDQQ